MKINNVAIVGGTHGNELTGIFLLKKWGISSQEVTRPSFKTNLFFGNPKAATLNQRFVDEDLNRCFARSDLASPNKQTYESLRASYLNQAIGPKDASKHDFIIDMHTSTSNCGAMIIFYDDRPLNLRMASYILTKVPEARVCLLKANGDDLPYIGSICDHSLAVEIGPIPQGLLQSNILKLTADVVQHALDFLQSVNEGTAQMSAGALDVFQFKGVISFPQKDGEIAAVVHPSLQNSDYKPLHKGDPIFEMLDGTIVRYEGEETVYPVFINEAAYYYKNVAMSLCVKQTLTFPDE